MTDLYAVRVLAVEPPETTLEVTNVYGPAITLPSPSLPTFFFRALSDAGPLGRELATEKLFDEAWVVEHAAEYVESITVLATRDFPAPLRDAEQDAPPPVVVYRVRVRSARWIEHLAPGVEWDTTAYETRPVRRGSGPSPGRDADVATLGVALEHADSRVAYEAAERLGELGAAARDAVPQLAPAVSDANLDVASCAIEALGSIGDPRGASALVVALGATHASSRAKAATALARLVPPASFAEPALRRALEIGDTKLRATAGAALWRTSRDRDGLAALRAGLEGDDESVLAASLSAARGLSRDDAVDVVTSLVAALGTPSDLVVDVIDALGALGPTASVATDELQQLLDDASTPDWIAERAALALRSIESAPGRR